jgi:hypothetical protein
MQRTLTTIKQLSEHVGQTVTLQGWVYNTRSSGKIAFIILRDGTGQCQCVIEKNETTDSFFDEACKLSQESSLEITGLVRKEERSVGGHELAVTALDDEVRDDPVEDDAVVEPLVGEIDEVLGRNDYARLRFGISGDFPKGYQVDYVLGKWTKEEEKILGERIPLAIEIIKSFGTIGIQLTMTQFNNK